MLQLLLLLLLGLFIFIVHCLTTRRLLWKCTLSFDDAKVRLIVSLSWKFLNFMMVWWKARSCYRDRRGKQDSSIYTSNFNLIMNHEVRGDVGVFWVVSKSTLGTLWRAMPLTIDLIVVKALIGNNRGQTHSLVHLFLVSTCSTTYSVVGLVSWISVLLELFLKDLMVRCLLNKCAGLYQAVTLSNCLISFRS